MQASASVGLQVLRVHGHCADKEDGTPVIVQSIGHHGPERESRLFSATGLKDYLCGPSTPMCAHARRTRARGPEAGQSPSWAPHVFFRMRWSSRSSLLWLSVGRTRGAGKILRLDLLDVELRYTLAHRLQNIFERRDVALDPSQRVDAYHDKRTQVRTHQSAFL